MINAVLDEKSLNKKYNGIRLIAIDYLEAIKDITDPSLPIADMLSALVLTIASLIKESENNNPQAMDPTDVFVFGLAKLQLILSNKTIH